VVAVKLPEVPVIVTVAVPVVAVALAVNVSTLVPVVGLVRTLPSRRSQTGRQPALHCR